MNGSPRLCTVIGEYKWDHKLTSPAVYEVDDFFYKPTKRIKDTRYNLIGYGCLVIFPFPLPIKLVNWIVSKRHGHWIYNILPIWFV